MPLYQIDGIQVEFPFQAYECQLTYMQLTQKVITALQFNQNTLLESPTGTGKTLCLLSAVLSWRAQFAKECNFSQDLSQDPINKLTRPSLQSHDQVQKQQNIAIQNASNSHSDRIPKIIYTSITHSQLSQAMSELKRLSHKLKVTILASREQCCINEEIAKLASNSTHQNAMF